MSIAVASIGGAYRQQAAASAVFGGNEGSSSGDSSVSSNSSSSSSSSSSDGTKALVAVAEGVPEWVASLARLLSQKAKQQLGVLQPWQVAAVMNMVGGNCVRAIMRVGGCG